MKCENASSSSWSLRRNAQRSEFNPLERRLCKHLLERLFLFVPLLLLALLDTSQFGGDGFVVLGQCASLDEEKLGLIVLLDGNMGKTFAVQCFRCGRK